MKTRIPTSRWQTSLRWLWCAFILREAACFLPSPSQPLVSSGHGWQFSERWIRSPYFRSHRTLCAAADVNQEAWTDLRQILGKTTLKLRPPEEALRTGSWFKLICGASYQDLPRIRTLAMVYTLAGADCIDVSANEAVVTTAIEGMEDALLLAESLGFRVRRPWVMVSVNDQEDLHFRKASFDPTECPADCPRPCETVCPTQAISFSHQASLTGPVVDGVSRPDRCYGCGRCLPVCPLGLISARSFILDAPSLLRTLRPHIDAIEIHTNATTASLDPAYTEGSLEGAGEVDPFVDLWRRIEGEASTLKAVSVSFPFMGEQGTAAFLRHRSGLLAEAGTAVRIWQTDGRPMSGDIGRGATLTAVRFGEKVLESGALHFGGTGGAAAGGDYVQLAGGTNAYTADKLREMGLLSAPEAGGGRFVSGLAFGGYARKVVNEVLEKWAGVLEGEGEAATLLDHPQVLVEAVAAAAALVGGIKRPLQSQYDSTKDEIVLSSS